jgi:hypothetical protein
MVPTDSRMAIGSIETVIARFIGVTIIEMTSTVIARAACAMIEGFRSLEQPGLVSALSLAQLCLPQQGQPLCSVVASMWLVVRMARGREAAPVFSPTFPLTRWVTCLCSDTAIMSR